LEFFAGIGLARLGLEAAGFRVVWANDCEPYKKAMYHGHFGDAAGHSFVLGDIGAVCADTLPRDAALAWASSPCTDLSPAGGRAGLAGAQSGVFWHFIRLLRELGDDRPAAIVLENVTGLATSQGGDDLAAAIMAFNELGYSVDVLAIDARRFVPQSRPRLFLIGAQNPPPDTAEPASELRPDWLRWVFDAEGLRTHRALLPAPPPPMCDGLDEFVDDLPPDDQRWWDQARTDAFLATLSGAQRDRVSQLRGAPGVTYRTAYRRTREGAAVWEVRPDEISGCLRTARGGSSRQALVKLGDRRLQVRWMTPREYARLMGAGDYNLTAARTNQALFGFGDAVAVPAVSWLAENYLLPLIQGAEISRSGGSAGRAAEVAGGRGAS
jgi:DNA (cytosine-5)-methyltransferase 1